MCFLFVPQELVDSHSKFQIKQPMTVSPDPGKFQPIRQQAAEAESESKAAYDSGVADLSPSAGSPRYAFKSGTGAQGSDMLSSPGSNSPYLSPTRHSSLASSPRSGVHAHAEQDGSTPTPRPQTEDSDADTPENEHENSFGTKSEGEQSMLTREPAPTSAELQQRTPTRSAGLQLEVPSECCGGAYAVDSSDCTFMNLVIPAFQVLCSAKLSRHC